MRLDEIVNTCMHERVAEAAVASIGAGVAQNVRRFAEARDMSVGVYVGGLVRRFAWRAGPGERLALTRAMDRAQTPILAGLRHILEAMLKEERAMAAEVSLAASRIRHSLDAAA